VSAPLIPLRAWSTARGVTPRQGQVYRSQGRLPGAVDTGNGWLVPADVEPLPVGATSRDVAPVAPAAISADIAAMPHVLPAGLWELPDVARFYGTTVGRVRVMGAHPRSPFIVGRYGPPDRHGRATWRVWVL
jgi:hypothetical protein